MKLLTTRNGSYLTGTEIADAVMHYGLALCRRRDVDIVDVPFVAVDGTVGRVQLTVGWLTETTAVSSAEPVEELVEVDTILALYTKARSWSAVRAHPFGEEDAQRHWDYFDEWDY